MKFNFPPKTGSGIAKHLPQASAECLDLLVGMLQYDPELRFSARQALKHPYFKELRDAEKRARAAVAEVNSNPAATAAASSMHVDAPQGLMTSSSPTPDPHQQQHHIQTQSHHQDSDDLQDTSPIKAKDAKVCHAPLVVDL
jgi:renal tumor antigen